MLHPAKSMRDPYLQCCCSTKRTNWCLCHKALNQNDVLCICKLCKTIESLTNTAIGVMDRLVLLDICAATDINPEQTIPTYFAITQGMMVIYDAIQIDIGQFVLDLVIMEFSLDESRMLASFFQAQ